MNYSKHLKNNEELHRVIYQSPLAFFKPAVTTLVLITLPFFLMFLLFRWQTMGLVLFFLLLFIGLFALVRLIVLRSSNVFIVTSSRVIMFKQRALFDRQVQEADLSDITDVAYRVKGFWQTIGNYGSLRIQVADNEKNLIVVKIPRPRQVQQYLLQLIKEIGNNEDFMV